ncbi:retrovirus-related pol polyprotein from transposon TNT 1-94, partial [Tanacetum coccineum]
EVIALNKPDTPLIEDTKGPPDLINTEGTHEKMFRMNKLSSNPLKEHQGTILKYQCMLTRSMAAKLTTASTSECLFADFLSDIEPKKVYEALKHPVARIEAIRIFLAFATYMNFKVYQMDVKGAFLNGKMKEEVYVKQPLGFESREFPDYVCKLDKALYGLKQAPKGLV